MNNRVNVYVSAVLSARVRAAGITNMSAIVRAALEAACWAMESGESRTVTFDPKAVKAVVVRIETISDAEVR